ncbi:hypothetical protein LJC57_05595 [Parabacteroides sp. OttesenSCG-928-G07]|nr:hypothetical protein [Parabacteroides sp. OttesenSCG-928-G21]MDL2278047.1 hypothetical protein [Parabacteroides sp. OttesenSCG-928-G07]
MHNEVLYNSFLEEVVQKIPQKADLANVLADMLCLGKEAVYRRLRREVPFSFHEVMTIAKQLNISLDNLEMINSAKTTPFKLKLIEYINPAESDFALMEEMTTIMKSFKETSAPEAGEITNILPQPLYVTHKHIFKFYLFKWKYQSDSLSKFTPYKDIVIVDKLQKSQEEYAKWAKRLRANYVFDRLIFQYLVTNIKYFHQVGLITYEEVQLIKQDLLEVLDEIDQLSSTGFWEETGKKVNIYISRINVDTNYIYVTAKDYQLTIIKAFLLNGIASTDKKTFEEVEHWMRSMKQQSNLITGSGEKERIIFLKEQYDIIESLSQP